MNDFEKFPMLRRLSEYQRRRLELWRQNRLHKLREIKALLPSDERYARDIIDSLLESLKI